MTFQTIIWGISDTAVIARRNLLRYGRLPQLLVFSSIQPILTILLFNYVFGGAIEVDDITYLHYLVPGICVHSALLGTIHTGVGLADDMSSGIIDRFRSLPMISTAVVGGRILADSVRIAYILALLIGVASLIGFRFQNGLFEAIGAIFIAIMFAQAFSWCLAFLAVTLRDVETVQSAAVVVIFPLTFVSSAFVPIDTMPGWLQIFVEVSPVTVTVESFRELSQGSNAIMHIWQSLVWIGGIFVVFVPLTAWRYQNIR